MKILVINNIYPPMQVGGYEQLCFDVVEGLKRRGHSVCVLTSDCGVGQGSYEDGIERLLKLDVDFYGSRTVGSIRSALQNKVAFAQVLKKFDTDLIFVWNLENVSRFLIRQIHGSGRKVVYHLSSPWILQNDAFMRRMAKREGAAGRNAIKHLLHPIFSRIGMLFDPAKTVIENATFSCASLRDSVFCGGVRVNNAFIVHEGIAVEKFPERKWEIDPAGKTLKLLYAGQLVRHKGVHTAINAAAKLAGIGKDFRLTIIGKGEPAYEQYLWKLVENLRLGEHVLFLPPVQRDRLGAVVVEHDLLIFPSIWEEPWSLMLLIAMACGIGVVGTARGGSGELLVHGVNALVFPAEDEVALADQVRRLDEDRPLLERIARTASKSVRFSYCINTMIDRMEEILQGLVDKKTDLREG